MPDKIKPRSLRVATMLLAAVCLLIFMALCFFVFDLVMPAMLRTSENKYLDRQLDVVADQLDSAHEHVRRMTQDTAY